MSSVSEQLKEYGLAVRESDSPERDIVDFSIEDGEDDVATIWGNNVDDVDWECNHPYECIDFGNDIEEQGECLLCGSYCDWHRVPDENTPGYPEPHEWYPRRDVGGLIGEYLEELKGKEQYDYSTYRNYNSYAIWF